jgi:transcriptional regulator with XRE-family HTH domain
MEASGRICDFSILRELRKRESMSIADLAGRSGISASVISKLERNRTTAEMVERGEKTVLACAARMGIGRVITAGKRNVLVNCRLKTETIDIERYMVPEWMVEAE